MIHIQRNCTLNRSDTLISLKEGSQHLCTKSTWMTFNLNPCYRVITHSHLKHNFGQTHLKNIYFTVRNAFDSKKHTLQSIIECFMDLPGHVNPHGLMNERKVSDLKKTITQELLLQYWTGEKATTLKPSKYCEKSIEFIFLSLFLNPKHD